MRCYWCNNWGSSNRSGCGGCRFQRWPHVGRRTRGRELENRRREADGAGRPVLVPRRLLTDGILFGKIIHSIVGVFVDRRTACRGIEDRIVLRRQRNPSVCTAERTVTRSRTWEIERRLDDHGALRVGTYSRNRRQGRRWWRWTQSNPARKWISNYRIVAADCSQSSTTVCER